MKYSQKSAKPPPSGHIGRLNYTRQYQWSAEGCLNPKQYVFDPGLELTK
uniref:Uncharacterized protein n=1 Tax=Anguilla anguilla TaxID=7936 RepID=A0A0E9VR27_ANGAN